MLNTSKSRLYSLLFVTSINLFACATERKLDAFVAARSSLKNVNISVADFAPKTIPEVDPDLNPNKRAAVGGAKGAAPGIAGMAMISPLCGNPYTAGVCVVFMPIYALLAATGGTLGAIHEETEAEATIKSQKILAEAIKADAAQNTLVTKIIEYGKKTSKQNYIQTVSDIKTSDAQLEVALLKVEGLNLGFLNRQYAIVLEARARLKNSNDGTVMADRNYRYVSPPREVKQWAENSGATLFSEIDNSYNSFAEWIVDDFFLGRLADKTAIPDPISPPIKSCSSLFCRKVSGELLTFTPVKSLKPTFQWHFNTELLQATSNISYEIILQPNVHYEFRIFKTIDSFWTNSKKWAESIPVYIRTGLNQETHTIEDNLEPCTDYLWTVKAIVDQNGIKNASEWSGKYPNLDITYLDFAKITPDKFRVANNKPTLMTKFEWENYLLEHRPFNHAYPFSTPCESKTKSD